MVVAKGYADDSRKDGHVWIVGGYAGHDLQWQGLSSETKCNTPADLISAG